MVFFRFKKKIYIPFSDKQINIFSWGILFTAIIFNFITILKSSVNIPFMDEWSLIPYLGKFDIGWLFNFHNEHRIVFTKLVIFLLYKLNGWNIYTGIVIDYLLFFITTVVLYKIIKPICKDFAMFPLFFLPLYSVFNQENLTILFQSQFHFMILFGLLAVIFGFLRKRCLLNNILFALFLNYSIYSMNFAFATGIMIVYIIKELLHGENKFINLFVPLALFLPALMYFFVGFPQSTTLIYPWRRLFRIYYSNLLILGITGKQYPLIIEKAMTIILTIYVAIKGLFNKENKNNNVLQAIFAVFIASSCSIAAISSGRANYQLIVPARHIEIVTVIIPLLLSLFYFDKIKNGRKWFFIYFLVLVIGFSQQFNYLSRIRGQIYKEKSIGLDCAKSFYEYSSFTNMKSYYCTTVFPYELKDLLIDAKKFNLSFTRSPKKK